MHTANPAEYAREVVSAIRAEREGRTRVLEAARAARRDARYLRNRTSSTVEAHLVHGWRLWSAGLRSQPPGKVPAEWSDAERGDPIALAERSCAELEAAAGRFATTGSPAENPEIRTAIMLVGAGAGVARRKMENDLHDSQDALSICVRLIETREPAFSGPLTDPYAVLAASAARRCLSECRRALALGYAENG